MAHYRHGCTPSQRHPGYCAECGEPLVIAVQGTILLIPDPVWSPEWKEGDPPPFDIEPGRYTVAELVELLRAHKNDPEAIQFIADMMEE